MGECDDFKLRQYRMPEERMQRHHQRQPGIALADKDQGKTAQGTQRAQTHDQQAPAGVIPKPTPQVGRHAAHQHGDGYQFADSRTGKAQVMEVQRQKRRCGTEQGEIEKIET